jgi:hypothetical protein
MADTTSTKPEKKVVAKKKGSSKPTTSKPVAKKVIVKKPAVKKAAAKSVKKVPKAPKKASKASSPKVKATRKPRVTKIKITGFEEIMKAKAELIAVTSKAKKQLQTEYAKAVAQAEAIKAQYKDLFDESIETKATKAKRGAGKARKTGVVAPITKAEIESFIEQKEEGFALADIKISGRRTKSIKKIADAYSKAEIKDAASVLALLK